MALTIDGKPVIDLWGGVVDKDTMDPWQRDTIVTVYSTTKGMTAICAHRLVEQGMLDLNAPVAKYWPEFAQAGKAEGTGTLAAQSQGGSTSGERRVA